MGGNAAHLEVGRLGGWITAQEQEGSAAARPGEARCSASSQLDLHTAPDDSGGKNFVPGPTVSRF